MAPTGWPKPNHGFALAAWHGHRDDSSSKRPSSDATDASASRLATTAVADSRARDGEPQTRLPPVTIAVTPANDNSGSRTCCMWLVFNRTVLIVN